jgi:hypothetical protein
MSILSSAKDFAYRINGIEPRFMHSYVVGLVPRGDSSQGFVGEVKGSNASNCCDRGHLRRAVDLHGSSQ